MRFAGARRLIRKAALPLAASDAVSRVVRLLGARGLIPGLLWKRLPVQRRFTLSWSGRRLFDYDCTMDDPIGRDLFWRGWPAFEPETVPIFLALAKSARRFVDVGANTGIYSLLACSATPRVKVVAFEPVPEIHERLAVQIRLNGWENRCLLHREALSGAPGTGDLFIPEGRDYSSISRLALPGAAKGPGSWIKVPVTTLDGACPDGDDIDLVKIDVEGGEDGVIKGMLGILARCSPAVILECLPDGPVREIEASMKQLGYRFFHLRDQGAVAVDALLPDPTLRWRNFLCLGRNAPLPGIGPLPAGPGPSDRPARGY